MTETKSAATDPAIEVALGLLVEYTEKLRKLREKYMNNKNVNVREMHNVLSYIKDKYTSSSDEFHSLAEQASQRIEHVPLHPIDKLNLKLKLRDFEEQLRFFDRVVVSMIPASEVGDDPFTW